MRIVSPVDHLAEALPLLAAGADELYGGYVPKGWSERFSDFASINQRTFSGAQLESPEELATIVTLCRERGKRFSLTLNAPYYTDSQLPMILEVVAQAVAAGVNGIILADPGLLRILMRRYPEIEYQASTLAHLLNSSAIAFYQKLGISRAILPRHLTIVEMEAIVAASPGVACDAFLLVGKCPNTEGLCTFHHSSPDKIWPCEIPYQIEALNGEPSALLRKAMAQQGSWSQSDRRHGCGLCAIPHLARIGIDGLKLVGRGAPSVRKIAHVRLVRQMLDLAREELDFVRYRQEAMAAHRRNFNADCSRNVCYYPEFFPDDL
jgi:putative protease